MREIAEAAGLSTATISRALAAHPRIPDATRRRVHDLAASLGYHSNPLLSAYARQRRGATTRTDTTTLAYVTNFPTADAWRENPFYERLFLGAGDQARANGYHLEHFWMRSPGMTGKRLSDILDSRGIVGVCVAPTPIVRRLDLDWARFCCVTVGYSLQHPVLHRTAPHHFQAVLDAGRALWRRGYTRIGLCLHADTSHCVNDLWLAAAMLTRRHNPKSPLKVFIHDETSLARVPRWVRKERLQALLSDNHDARHILLRAGIATPGDIDYVTLNRTRDDAEIAGIDQRPEAVGAAAIDLLLGLLQRGERGVPHIPVTSMIDGEWIEGVAAPPR